MLDVHHENYNSSRKAKSNMQEDSDGPMTRARAKQLQRTFTSQIGMIEAASELKISNHFEIGSRVLICLQLELRDRKSP
jgi:anaerobic ribonucleoside-triphosphate reductase